METPRNGRKGKLYLSQQNVRWTVSRPAIRGVGGRTRVSHYNTFPRSPTHQLYSLTHRAATIYRDLTRLSSTAANLSQISPRLLYANRDVARLFGGGRARRRRMLSYSVKRNQIFIDGNSDLFTLLNTSDSP